MTLEIETSENGGRYVIKAVGEVDLNTSPELRKKLLKGVREFQTVIVDLSRTEYMDSSGVATLVEGLKTASKGDAALVLQDPSDAVMKVLQLARLDPLFTIESGHGS